MELVSYLELLAGQGDGAEDHEVLVSLQVDAARPVAGRAIKDLGGGDEGALLVLADELDLLAHRLNQAGVIVAGVLNRRGLASAIRNGFDPFGRQLRETGQQNGRVGGHELSVAHSEQCCSTQNGVGAAQSEMENVVEAATRHRSPVVRGTGSGSM